MSEPGYSGHAYEFKRSAEAICAGLAEDQDLLRREDRQARFDAYHFYLDGLFPPGPARFAKRETGICSWCRRDTELVRNGRCIDCATMWPGTTRIEYPREGGD